MIRSEEKKKNLPVGVDNFETMIQKNYYYFDKTGLIEEILKNGTSRILFIRPRRFGKSLNMSMLKYFFNIENKEENRKLFENLDISKSEYFNRQGQNPVIFISFKDYEETNWEDGYRGLKEEIRQVYKDFTFLQDKLNNDDLVDFDNILKRKKEANYDKALLDLSRYLYEYYGKKVILLIDEYDKPIIKSHVNGYYNATLNFFKKFFEKSVKGNDYAEITVMTGILRIAKEGIFSGLNNLKVNTVLSDNYTEYFGILENEVEEALKYYDLDFDLEEVKKWYNGYQFGKNKVYNPWSVINFLDDKKLEEHWINTSSNDEIMNYLENSDENIIFDFEELLSHKSIRKEIYDFVTFQDIDYALNLNRNSYGFEIKEDGANYGQYLYDFAHANIWQFFLHSGYLTIDKKVAKSVYDLRIPNEEIFDFFRIRFLYRTYRGHYRFYGLGEYLIKGDYEKFGKEIKALLKNAISFRDLKEENSYHLFVIGLVSIMSENYFVKSNVESGDGIPDLVLKPRNKKDKAFIFEFKYSRAKDSRNLKRTAKSALKQINDRNYVDGLKYEGYENVVKIGMGFRKKDVEVVVDVE
ncbi:AAA family ATPase [Leptotrichia trevisanii]|uniref:AAA family ATPase n=1 Tax=Leptotrichia trevisanii TaxID=109328 RepID=UPI0003FBE7C4|nr:AAA family ATPase [Leptotrichia trevisanii]